MVTLPPFETHHVDNQPPPFAPLDLWSVDTGLREAVQREGGGDFADTLARYGALAGSEAGVEYGADLVGEVGGQRAMTLT